MNKFWNFQARNNRGELFLYGDISDVTWYGDEVTPRKFREDLDALGDIAFLDIYINSGGGDVFAGQAIYSILERYPAEKTVYIDGLAASIASVIAMAGDKIVMPANAMMMIHNAWTIAAGNKEQLIDIADSLGKIDQVINGVYQKRTGKTAEEIAALMDAETWFTAAEAVEHGFADEIEESRQVAASVKGGFLMLNQQQFDLERYHNAPKFSDIRLEPNNGGESQPVEDISLLEQQQQFNQIRKKLLEG